MVKKRYARDPLFYIQQPKMEKPEAPMQHDYATPKNTSKAPPQQNEVNPMEMKTLRGKNFQQFQNAHSDLVDDAESSQTENENEDQVESQEDEPKDEENQNRPKFKDMTIEEKIDYFVNIPPHIPKLKCEIKTEERTYRGIVLDRNEEEIFMRTGRKKSSIPANEITEIRMLGM